MSEAFSMKWVVEKQGFTTRIRFKKRLFNSKENQKTQKKRPSSVDETRKTPKNARHRSTKYENRWKTLVVGRRNAENAEKHSSSVDETRKTPKKRPSSVDEIEKMVKISFPPWLKLKKRQKSTFRHGGWVENSKNSVSATAETEKQPQNNFNALRETQKHPQNGFNALRET